MRNLTETEFEFIAQTVHEMNRAYCISLGDHSQPHWEDALSWRMDSCIEGVRGALNGNSPQESHESWMRLKLKEGWKHGKVKDLEKKEHPCMVEYDKLPFTEKLKDHNFVGVVMVLAENVRLETATEK